MIGDSVSVLSTAVRQDLTLPRVSEFRAPDVQSEELLTSKNLQLVSEIYDGSAKDQNEGSFPMLATVAIVVLASLVTILLSVLSIIAYYKYQKRKMKQQPLKAINRLDS